MTTRVPEFRCWRCNYKMDSTTSAIGDAKPEQGDVSMCLSCGALGVFTKELLVRRPTPEEEVRFVSHPTIGPLLLAAQLYRDDMIGDKLKDQS